MAGIATAEHFPTVEQCVKETVEHAAFQHARRRSLLTVKQLVEQNPCFKEAGVRWWIFHADSNGMRSAIVRIGRKVLIDEAKFWAWVDAQQESNNGYQ